MSIARRLAVALLLVGLALAALSVRARFVRAFFVDAAPGAGPVLTSAPPEAPTLPRSDRVRVLLLDGLSAAHADTLPNLGALCREGLDLRVDNGFPTVSLPVQHVLWTGRTQASSGLWYRIERLPEPPLEGLPRRVAGSVGVAESHADIVGSFGFAQAMPAVRDDEAEAQGSAWRREGFSTAAVRAVASPARLVFVHVLRIDEAGHAKGADSVAYALAAAHADGLLQVLREVAGPEATWLVLADHGHRPEGGHGGAEDAIRVVRACLVGPGIAAADHRGSAPIHLVDLHRGLADALGVREYSMGVGRPIAFALEHPDPGATLPRPSALGLLLALGLALGAAAAVGLWVGRRMGGWPWWVGVAYVSIVALEGWPTLSNPMIYPRNPTVMLVAALPGAVVLAIAAWVGLRREGLPATLVAQGAPIVALLLAALVVGGGSLMPWWTAHASVGFVLVALGSAVLAVVVAVTGGR